MEGHFLDVDGFQKNSFKNSGALLGPQSSDSDVYGQSSSVFRAEGFLITNYQVPYLSHVISKMVNTINSFPMRTPKLISPLESQLWNHAFGFTTYFNN